MTTARSAGDYLVAGSDFQTTALESKLRESKLRVTNLREDETVKADGTDYGSQRAKKEHLDRERIATAVRPFR